MNQIELEFMSELQSVLDKYNARLAAVTNGYGEYMDTGLSVIMYADKPIVGGNNTITNRIDLPSVIVCHNAPLTVKR